MTEYGVGTETINDDTGKHIDEFDPDEGGSVTTQLASAVAEATGQNVTELPPLGEWVDCDALEQLFDRRSSRSELSVSFEFEGRQVFVSSVGRIVVEQNADDPV